MRQAGGSISPPAPPTDPTKKAASESGLFLIIGQSAQDQPFLGSIASSGRLTPSVLVSIPMVASRRYFAKRTEYSTVTSDVSELKSSLSASSRSRRSR